MNYSGYIDKIIEMTSKAAGLDKDFSRILKDSIEERKTFHPKGEGKGGEATGDIKGFCEGAVEEGNSGPPRISKKEAERDS